MQIPVEAPLEHARPAPAAPAVHARRAAGERRRRQVVLAYRHLPPCWVEAGWPLVKTYTSDSVEQTPARSALLGVPNSVTPGTCPTAMAHPHRAAFHNPPKRRVLRTHELAGFLSSKGATWLQFDSSERTMGVPPSVLYSIPVSRCTSNSGFFWMKKSGFPQPAPGKQHYRACARFPPQVWLVFLYPVTLDRQP